MKRLTILGAGTGGTIVANRMRRRLGHDWTVTVVDPDTTHLYQPGLLFLPFGHANCFVETGFGKALLIDFNYDVEPLPGRYPLPILGPMSLLRESRLNHIGKLGFRWLYWNALLPGRSLPVPTRMSMIGKQRPATADAAFAARRLR